MSLNGAITAAIRGSEPLVSRVGDRVRPIILAPGEERPALTFRLINVVREKTQDGGLSSGDAMLQLAVWSDDLDERDAIAELAIDQLHCFDGTVTLAEADEEYELILFQKDNSDDTDPPEFGEEFPLYASLLIFSVQFQKLEGDSNA